MADRGTGSWRPRMTSAQHNPTRVAVPYLVAQDNGAVLASAGDVAHEFFHDARHSLGMPCH
ncbi:hypothetical protein GCM10023162_37880 [Klenkia terrae]